jgi:hypothetical protein
MTNTKPNQMKCDEAWMIMRANTARFCNAPQDPELVRRADEVAKAHYFQCCPCCGFDPVAEAFA